MSLLGAIPLSDSPAPQWSAWERIGDFPALSADVLAEILDGGQAFRWQRIPADAAAERGRTPGDEAAAPAGGDRAYWRGIWGDNVVRLRLAEDERLEWSAPAAAAARTKSAVTDYFALTRDFAALADTLPWRSDPHLARCVIAFHGLRILKQPFGETLLGFLCSATKQIVQIKQMMALLAQHHGASVASIDTAFLPRGTAHANTPDSAGDDHTAAARRMGTAWHRLPTWTELAEIPEPELRKCLLGFRARYIAETAQFLAAHPGWLEETETLPYATAKERLCSLPGVGEKVADCVLLFGAGRLEGFPVDVWILKTMARRYALEGWRPAQLAQFGRVHFGPLAGLAQQYLFAWERRHGKTPLSPAG